MMKNSANIRNYKVKEKLFCMLMGLNDIADFMRDIEMSENKGCLPLGVLENKATSSYYGYGPKEQRMQQRRERFSDILLEEGSVMDFLETMQMDIEDICDFMYAMSCGANS